MLEGKITRLDRTARTALVVANDGRELEVRFPEGLVVEVCEPETMGTVGSDLEDLHEGYLVAIEVGAPDADSTHTCASLVCLS